MDSILKQLIQQEKQNVFSTLNVQELLKAAENVDMEYLGKKTLKTISEEIVQVLLSSNIPEIEPFCEKLTDYRHVDQIYQIQKGKHIRWIRTKNVIGSFFLTNGGIVVDVKFTEDGVQILCKNKNRFIKYNFDDCLTFQKLSADEQMILSCVSLMSIR
jgi:hypothetical protein